MGKFKGVRRWKHFARTCAYIRLSEIFLVAKTMILGEGNGSWIWTEMGLTEERNLLVELLRKFYNKFNCLGDLPSEFEE